ncbi:MAG: hypothetical protein ABI744_03280 [Chloroflexota bacterium]
MVRAVALAIVVALLTASVVVADVFPIVGNRFAPSGNGWRLVTTVGSTVDPDANMAFRVRAARDRAAFTARWHGLGWEEHARTDATGIQPWLAVDFEREIVVLFGVGIGSCTDGVDLEDVVIDASNRLVYSITKERSHCGFLDLTGAIVFVVALDRGALPASPFTLRLHAQPTCRSCTEPEDELTL